MTDQQAVQMANKIRGVSLGSIVARVIVVGAVDLAVLYAH